MADSYKIKFKKGVGRDDENVKNSACFSSFNYIISNSKFDIEEAIIVIEDYKVNNYSEEFIDTYLNEILKTGIIPYKINKTENSIELLLNLNEVEKKSQLIYTGMVIRCLYEPCNRDKFTIIAKHFVNLCNYFPEKDRGELFTISCNIYLAESGYFKYGYGFNPNHILMYNIGCKIMTTEKIKDELIKDSCINDIFTSKVTEEDKYKLSNTSKEEYSKTL